MDNLQVGDKILHQWHGPFDVTFVGADYIGICTDDGRHAMFRKEPEQFCPWSEKAESEWRTAQAEQETAEQSRKTLCWPDSTFRFEPQGSEHFMGSHWEPFFEDGAEGIVSKLPEAINEADIVTGFGSIKEPHRPLPEDWVPGYHLVWPQTDRGVIITIAVDDVAKQNRLCTVYPFWADGQRHRLVINEVAVWEAGVEAQITATIGEAEITLYDAHYLLNRSWYECGREYDFILSGIAYGARPAEEIELPYTPNPDQVAWEAILAQQRGEEPPERSGTIRLGGSAFFLPISEWDVDDYSFRGPIKAVTLFKDYLGQDGWLVKATVMRLSDLEPEDFDLDIVITARAWDGETPPEVGQDIEGRIWLQGYLKGV